MKTLETLFTIAGVPVVFATNDRVKAEDREEGLFYYELRFDEADFLPYSVEKRVWVNHYGTIATKEPIKDIELNEETIVSMEYELTEEETDDIIMYI